MSSPLDDVRKEIDSIDKELVELFEKRMATVKKVADIKKEANIRVTNPEREEEIVENISNQVSPEYRTYVKSIFTSLMASLTSFSVSLPLLLSCLNTDCSLSDKFSKAIYYPPLKAVVANNYSVISSTACRICSAISNAFSESSLFFSSSSISFLILTAELLFAINLSTSLSFSS